MPIQERAERTRRALLDAAAFTFMEEGLAAASVSVVVRRAGVTKGALYFHFSSKAALAEAVWLEASRIQTALIRQAGCRCHGRAPLQALIDFSHLLARQLASTPVFRAGVRMEDEVTARRFREYSLRDHWRALAGDCLAEAGLDRRTRERGVGLVSAMLTGIETLSRGESDWLRGEVLTGIWELLLPRLVPEEEAIGYRPAGAALSAEDLCRCLGELVNRPGEPANRSGEPASRPGEVVSRPGEPGELTTRPGGPG